LVELLILAKDDLKIDNLEIAYIIVMLESFLKLKCEVEE
jgi:hypothetical protein